MKAIFEAKFKQSDIIDKKTLKEEYNGNLLKVMQELWKTEGVGMFWKKDMKLTKIIKK